MTATRDNVRAAARALGYDPDDDNVMSIYADVDQIIVRRMENTGGYWTAVEDVTILNPDRVPPRQRADGDLGPMAPTSEQLILSPDCRDGNHTKCTATAWDEAANAPAVCQCRDLTHGTTGDPHA